MMTKNKKNIPNLRKKEEKNHFKINIPKIMISYELKICLYFIIFLIMLFIVSFCFVGQMDPYNNGAWRA